MEPSLRSVSSSQAQPTLSNTCPMSPPSLTCPEGHAGQVAFLETLVFSHSREWDSLPLPTLPGGTLGQWEKEGLGHKGDSLKGQRVKTQRKVMEMSQKA